MAITDDGSLLILGAGSSNDFGLPLGNQLIDLIVEGTTAIGQFRNAYGSMQSGPSVWTESLLQDEHGFKNPIGAMCIQDFFAGRRQYTDSELRQVRLAAYEFGQVLENQTSDTIDDFVSLNPEHAQTAKNCIAAIFAAAIFEYDKKAHQIVARRFDQRQSPDNKNRNWIHLLINIARHHIRHRKSSRKIPVITFNYDGILERVLEKQFDNVGEEFGDYRDYFEILHPHGCCGEIPDQTRAPWLVALEWAKSIWVVNEDPALLPEAVQKDRERARQLVAEAKHIYAAGFSFSNPNCELLGLHDIKGRCKTTYHNYNNDIGVDIAVDYMMARRAGMTTKIASSLVTKGAGSDERPLSIANWIKAGYLGTMPG